MKVLMLMKVLLKLFILFILLLFSFFFSSAETALTTCNKVKLKAMADDGDSHALILYELLSDLNSILSAIIIGNCITIILASSIATILAIDLLRIFGVGITVGILTILILIFGEIVPKSIASANAIELSLFYIPALDIITKILSPLVFIVNKFSKLFLKIFKLNTELVDTSVTPQELKVLIDNGVKFGSIEEEEKEYINNVLDFVHTSVKDIMIPRVDITSISIDTSYEDTLEIIKDNMYTRLPVYSYNREDIVGIVNIKDLIGVSSDDFNLSNYVRSVLFTFEGKDINELFDDMRKKRMPFAIVLDEYGCLSGLVTMEDIVEELVGEIRDEFDWYEEDDIKQIDENTYEVVGNAPLEGVSRILNLRYKSDEYITFGGYMSGLFSSLPSEGSKYEDNDCIIEILKVHGHRVKSISIKIKDADSSVEEVFNDKK